MTTRMLPAIDLIKRALSANGRFYSGAPGSVVDVPDNDADILEANGWTRVSESGTTAQRPNPAATAAGAANNAARRYFDTTLGYSIVWDGATWRNPATGAAV